MQQRRLNNVPISVIALLVLGLAGQLVWQYSQGRIEARAQALHVPPAVELFHLLSWGEPVTGARLLDLWLQAHDNQPGISIPFREMNYQRVTEWLNTILQLDPRDTYPLLVASKIYASINDPQRVRIMLDFIEAKYREDPQRRWRWLADAALVAKYRLKDMPLALRYANTLAEHAGDDIPFWARDIRILTLADMGETEAARVLIGGLLENGEITDPHELRFLQSVLQRLEQEVR